MLGACGGGSDGEGAQAPPPSLPPPTAPPPSPEPPAWLPAEGTVQALSTGNDLLSQNGRLAGWESAFGKIVDDFSGGVFNPYWGPLGAMVFHGGGHAATFDNSVVVLDFNDLRFKRLSDPTPSGNGQFWNNSATDPAFDPEHCEYGDGQPGSAHTYDTLAILPPEHGGASLGSLIRVGAYAVHPVMARNTSWAHRFDFDSLSITQGRWSRYSTNALGSMAPGSCSAYDTRRKRFWWTAALSSSPQFVRYLSADTRQQVQVAFRQPTSNAPPASPDSTTMRYDPVRDLLIMSCTVGSALRLAYLSCATPENGWRTAVLAQDIPARAGWSHPFDHVPAADKFVMLAPADASAVYDFIVPPDPATPWAVTRQPLVGGTLPAAYVAGKRWSFSPAARCFLWMASSTSNVLAYRPSGA